MYIVYNKCSPALFLTAMGVASMMLVSVLLSSASRVLLVSLGEAGLTLLVLMLILFCSSLFVSLYSAMT